MPNVMVLSALALVFAQTPALVRLRRSSARIPAMMAKAQEAQLSMNQGMHRTVDILREARQRF